MTNKYKFDREYYINAINQIENLLQNKKMKKSEIDRLKSEIKYFKSHLNPLGPSVTIDVPCDEIMEALDFRMRSQLEKLGIKTIESLYSIVCFITRQSSNSKIIFKEKVDNKDNIFNSVLEFYADYNEEFYITLNKLVNNKINLYNITDNNKAEDQCIFMCYNNLPIVNIYDTKNYQMHITLAHEMQHQIDEIINLNTYKKYMGFNHFLRETSAIFSELLYCDNLSDKNPDLIDINSLYLCRIKSIESIACKLKLYLETMMYIYYSNEILNQKRFFDLCLNNLNYSSETVLEQSKKLLNINLYDSIKYIHSYLVALDMRELYKQDPKEAFKLIKYIINLNVSNYNKIDSLELNHYRNGSKSHIKHVIGVDEKRLLLENSNLCNRKI